jgi:hypothetical protein
LQEKEIFLWLDLVFAVWQLVQNLCFADILSHEGDETALGYFEGFKVTNSKYCSP